MTLSCSERLSDHKPEISCFFSKYLLKVSMTDMPRPYIAQRVIQANCNPLERAYRCCSRLKCQLTVVMVSDQRFKT